MKRWTAFYQTEKSGDPAPLQVKNVWIDERRYIVCLNVDQAKKDRADRDAIVAALEEQLQRGDKSLVGNRGSVSACEAKHVVRAAKSSKPLASPSPQPWSTSSTNAIP